MIAIIILLFSVFLFLGIFAFIKILYGEEIAKNGLFSTLAISVLALYVLLPIISLVMVFTVPAIGIPLQVISCVISFREWKHQREDKAKQNDDVAAKQQYWMARNEARKSEQYLSGNLVSELKQALEAANDSECVKICKELSKNTCWNSAIPALIYSLAHGEMESKLCAIHGMRHVFDKTRIKRANNVKNEYGYSVYDYNEPDKEWGDLIDICRHRALSQNEEKRVRIAILLMAGNAGYDGLDIAPYLLQDNDADVRAAACRAIRQTLKAETASEIYASFFDSLRSNLETRHDRLTEEAISTAVHLANFGIMSTADIDGIAMIMHNISVDPQRSVKIHDCADTAIVALKNGQRNQRAKSGFASA